MKQKEQIQERIERKIVMLKTPEIPNKQKEIIQSEIKELRWVLKEED